MADLVGQQFGHYRLLRLLGAGAFASVYLGEHQYLERPAAIKVLHVQMEPSSHDAFLREARTIAHLDHPHIVRVLDFGITNQTPYLVMEYTPNGTLRTRYPKGTRLSLEQVATYVKQIASALDYAHSQHVIHRDVKPENLLLNAKGEIVLSDFGLAIVRHTLETLSGPNMAGTPLYMAPEQIQRHPCPASDQYTLGVMVYEWLCGEPPFPGPGVAIFGQHLYQAPPSLCERVSGLPPAVEDAVLRALAKDPAHRFITVQDFASALEKACLATQPLTGKQIPASAPQDLDDLTLPLPRVGTPRSFPAAPSTGLPMPDLAEQRPVVQQPTAPVAVMCLSAPADQALLEQWEAHLRPLEQAGTLTVWSESHLLAGSARSQQVNAHLAQAHLIVLLLSADFFSSEECVALMGQALQLQQRGEARVVPLLLRPVEWRASPLASFFCIPSNGPAVTEWTNRDAAFDWCVRDLRHLLGQPVTTSPRVAQLPTTPLQHQNRLRLLRRVRAFWIEGVLEHSLHGAALMTLGLQARPDVVANPWHLVLQQPEATPHPLPAGTRITEVYDAADGELLILGAPGAGKTTLLLELARDLLKRAEQDELHPLPVVFNLSSWGSRQQPLLDWLAEELATKYQVPRKLALALLSADQILPLLDGLDEVAPTARTACVEAINTYRQEHGLLPLIVCSRQADYLSQTARVLVRSAVLVQPLTQEQVDAYLEQGGEPLWALRVALHQDATLRELTSTPLMLSILTLTYHGKPIEELLRNTSLQERQQQILEQYVQRMLTRRGPLKAGTPQQVVQWLAFLAARMHERNQAVFYLEQLQPDWLPPQLRRAYSWLGVRLPGILIGIVASLGISLFVDVASAYNVSLLIQSGVLGGFLGGLFSGETSFSEYKGSHLSRQHRHQTVEQIVLCFLMGLLIALSSGLSLGKGLRFSDWLRNGSIDGVTFALSSLLLWFLLPVVTQRSVSSTYRSAQREKHLKYVVLTVHGQRTLLMGIGFGLLYGLSGGLSSGLLYGPNQGLITGLFDGVSMALSAGAVSVLVSLILNALTGGIQLTERLRWTWSSLTHSLLASQHIRTTLVLLGAITVSNGLLYGFSIGLFNGLFNGLSAGLLYALSFGLITTAPSGEMNVVPNIAPSIVLSYWVVVGLFQGIASERVEEQWRQVPGQGIRDSLRNSILMGGISCGLFWLISAFSFLQFWLSSMVYNMIDFGGLSSNLGNRLRIIFNVLSASLSEVPSWLSAGLVSGWMVGLCGGLLVCLIAGGLAALRHGIIRLLLRRARVFPRHYVRFLDEMASCILLQKVGGGYSFVHRLLLEYFASLEQPDRSRR